MGNAAIRTVFGILVQHLAARWVAASSRIDGCLVLCGNGIFSKVSKFNSGQTTGNNLSATRKVLQPMHLLKSRSSLELETNF